MPTKKNKSKKNGKMVVKSHPPVPMVVGQGGYFTDALKAIGRTVKDLTPAGTFAKLGQAGGDVFGPLGGKVGQFLGSKIADIAGFGAYDVSQNSLMARVSEGVEVPQFRDAAHATIVRHREFVGNITAVGGTAFTLLSYPINPGLSSSFPWLSQVASSYDSYQMLGCIFEFKTLSSDITSGGALGSVVLATDYDSADASYASKVVMENSEYAVSAKPSVCQIHAVECDPAVTFSSIKFIRDAPVPSGKDVRLYDMGNFQIATEGLPTSSGTLGELWVSYEVALYKPNLIAANPLGFAHFSLPTVTSSHYLGADTTTIYNPDNGTLGGTCQNSTYTFPPGVATGTFLVAYQVIGDSTSITVAMTLGTLVNCSAVAVAGGKPLLYSNQIVLGGSATESNNFGVYAVTVTSAGASVAFTSGNLPANVVHGDFIVSRIA